MSKQYTDEEMNSAEFGQPAPVRSYAIAIAALFISAFMVALTA